MIMILVAFPQVGSSLTVAAAFATLISLYAKQPYAEKKAAGSLGGSIAQGVLVLHNACCIRER